MKKEWIAKIDGRNMDNTDIISAICENRGIDDLGDFLLPTEDNLIEYEKLHNINRAWGILDSAITQGIEIEVIADVDVDGCTAGAIMYRYIRNFTDKVKISINQDKVHGIEDYDIDNCTAGLIIIVDSINTADEYRKFTDNGKNVIVLDHHVLLDDSEKYKHITLVSSANDYPNPQLSGAGVVWKFCKYCDEMYLTEYADELIDLAATGIIADMCNLSVPENRYICYTGLNNLHNLGLRKINGTYQFNSQSVSFGVAPLVNACNRLNENTLALRLFLSDNESELKQIIKDMKKVKKRQNMIVDNLMNELAAKAEQQLNRKMMTFIIDNEEGIAGLVANKIMAMYHRPILVLKHIENKYKGSMRACGLADFSRIVNETGLATCEGHENAAGIFIDDDKYEDFIESIDNTLSNIDYKESIIADIQLDIDQINTQLIDSIKSINFVSGTGFKPITVLIEGISDYEIGSLSKGKHLKLTIGDKLIIKWNYDGGFDEFENSNCSIIAELNNGYLGRTFYNQLIIQDYKVSDKNEKIC